MPSVRKNERFEKMVQKVNADVERATRKKYELEQVMREEAERQSSGAITDVYLIIGNTKYYFDNFLNKYNFTSMLEEGKTPEECMQFVIRTEPVES